MPLVLLAACAGAPPQPEFATEKPQTDAQSRARIHTELAANYYARRQPKVALEELSNAMRADPSYGPAYNVLGLVYMEMREDTLAEQNFRRALEISPSDYDARNNYGSFLCSRQRFDEGVEQYMAALKNPLYPTPEQSYVNAGTCMLTKGDLDRAATHFQRALAIAPLQPMALLRMTDIQYRRGEFPDAHKLLARYMQVVQTPPPEALWLGVRVERKLGDAIAEQSYASRLRKNFPDSREAKALQQQQYD